MQRKLICTENEETWHNPPPRRGPDLGPRRTETGLRGSPAALRLPKRQRHLEDRPALPARRRVRGLGEEMGAREVRRPLGLHRCRRQHDCPQPLPHPRGGARGRAARNAGDGLWGFVDYYGRWKYQPIYEAANPHQGRDPKSFASVRKDGRWGCIDGRGVLVVNNIFLTAEQAEEAGQQWAIARNYYTWRLATTNPKTGLWGFVDYLGRWAVQPYYEDRVAFGSDNNYPYTQVKQDGRWGNIDRNGNIISSMIFFTKEDAAYALRQFEHGRTLEGWRLPVTNPADGKWGWVDWSGEWRIKPKYEDATRFANDTGLFATAKINGFWMAISDTGDDLSRAVFTLSSEAWAAGNEWDTHQELGHWLYPIMDQGTQAWGYVDYQGNWVIRPTLEDAKLFTFVWNNRVAPAKMDGKWGCIDHTGQFVVKNQFNTSAEAQIAGRQWAEGRKF